MARDPEKVAAIIGVPVEKWPGRCHEIAGLCLAAGLVEGTLRYGLYSGPISKKSIFAGRGRTHHGWVEVSAGDEADDPLACDYAECRTCGHIADEHAKGGFFSECEVKGCECADYDPPPKGPHIFDPTRWVFEAREPYIFNRKDTHGYYDMAGDKQRLAMLRPYPSAEENPGGVKLALKLALANEHAGYLCVVISLRGGPKQPPRDRKTGALVLTVAQAAWIANLPLALLGPHARAVYEALDAADLAAFVPIDNREVVMGDGFYGHRKATEARIRKAKAKR